WTCDGQRAPDFDSLRPSAARYRLQRTNKRRRRSALSRGERVGQGATTRQSRDTKAEGSQGGSRGASLAFRLEGAIGRLEGAIGGGERAKTKALSSSDGDPQQGGVMSHTAVQRARDPPRPMLKNSWSSNWASAFQLRDIHERIRERFAVRILFAPVLAHFVSSAESPDVTP